MELPAGEDGTVTVKYEMCSEEFQVTAGRLLAAQVDARLCLSFVMPGCTIHLSDKSPSERVAELHLPEEEQTVRCWLGRV